MAGVFASTAVKWALHKLSSLLPTGLTFPPAATSSSSAEIQDLEDLRKLERTMRRIHATLQDAGNHWNIREESAKLRLKELKEVAYDAEDVLEEYEYEVNRCKVQALHQTAGLNSNRKRKCREVNDEHSVDVDIVPVPNELVVRAGKIMERFNEIKDYSESFNLSESDGDRWIAHNIHSVRHSSSVIFSQNIIGREQDKVKVVENLLSGEGSNVLNPVSVLAIVGMGGLGKTTLAQLVYNDPTVRLAFDKVSWVCVSENFDVSNITRKIISSITKNNCDITELANLQETLVDEIQGKSLLLVLDDVWNERRDCWELLCMPLAATRLCKILITTRNEEVARLVQTMPFYRINCLSPDESWSLFKQVVFSVHQDNVVQDNLIQIGKNIVEKCKGLPLAIKTLGSALRYEISEMRWKDVLESQIWDLEQSRNEVLAALELSYKHMPRYLKVCFVSLALFPKDYLLHEHEVIRLWRLLDLLQGDGIDNECEIGNLYFNQLVQRSILQSYFCAHRIHDLIHDLACFVAGEEFFRLEDVACAEIPQGARYLSVISRSTWKNQSIQILNCSSFLTAIITMGGTYVNIENPRALFLNSKKLRVLSLEHGTLTEALPNLIGSLKLLRHLSLTEMAHNQFEIPKSMFQLFNLRTLDLSVSCQHEYALGGIGNLINLHTLPAIHISSCGCRCNIRELRNMNKIRELHICGLGSVSSIDDAKEAHLQNKKCLQTLQMDFSSQMQDCEHIQLAGHVTVSHELLLESLRPHHGLRVLTIMRYESEKFPRWLGNASFSMLTKMKLLGCKSRHLPTLGELPSLESLHVCRLHFVQHIGQEFCSLSPRVKGFRSLTELKFEKMKRWSEWSGVRDGEFSHLRTLSIFSASRLMSLPSVPFSSLITFDLSYCDNLATVPGSPTLRVLSIKGCPSLVSVGRFPSLTTLRIAGPFHDLILCILLKTCVSLEHSTIISESTTCIPLEPKNLPSLKTLRLSCPNLQYCDGLAGLTSIKELKVWGCRNLSIHSLLPRQVQTLDIRHNPAHFCSEFDARGYCIHNPYCSTGRRSI